MLQTRKYDFFPNEDMSDDDDDDATESVDEGEEVLDVTMDSEDEEGTGDENEENEDIDDEESDDEDPFGAAQNGSQKKVSAAMLRSANTARAFSDIFAVKRTKVRKVYLQSQLDYTEDGHFTQVKAMMKEDVKADHLLGEYKEYIIKNLRSAYIEREEEIVRKDMKNKEFRMGVLAVSARQYSLCLPNDFDGNDDEIVAPELTSEATGLPRLR
ncbi:hypothetical protein BU25DRAFT_466026 [Macroventuria anomochaeta]|uniref:Uncharacterized protein n=1 Tax=Macroventuria anomochaeta TaxID=301207 RepID=A0ACB6S5X8_9PLEO|nr:uncharacterized protein BU25DRAFT_466026 [Macroventuria anomochaeta]KAF2629020.1 hypothetical protein BU25DRAFT_466026 [Macroventuria anomochaeta]